MNAFVSKMKIHQELPPHVRPYPTVLGKMRSELLQTFNWVLAAYISIHKLFMPGMILLLKTNSVSVHSTQIGIWYLYHLAIGLMMSQWGRSPRHAYWIVYMAWFGCGFLPFALLESFIHQASFQVPLKTQRMEVHR